MSSSKRSRPVQPLTDAAASRMPARIAGIVLLLQAVAIVIVLAIHDHVQLPVTAALDGSHPVIARIDVGLAAVVLTGVVGLARLLPIRLRASGHTPRWIEFSFTSSVTVFLVAQLNGITEVGTLVLIYAITSGVALFTIVQERSEVQTGHPLLALCFGAAIGIVPWGVIAFYQIGAGVVGAGVPLIVRVITLVMLAFAIISFVSHWRQQRRSSAGGGPQIGERMHVLSSLVSTSVFAWLVVAGVVVTGVVVGSS